ncbi:hypothetical protein KPH14_003687 [Odynerus spinipes]|uniref:Carboxylic ester hydrolase n=1 Tax=Odynerus spinipes TaxID=1348599 RepID=A0AAD9RXZ8_9HYME|nr:hypothetical protein KPH14_003687 [Odynerus spinipes]
MAESRMDKPPVISTKFGLIAGKWSTSARDLPIANYLGIPYAEPPVGDLRFRSPQPWSRSWTGVRNVTQDGSPCVQRTLSGTILGEEDCLYLNVFVPEILDSRFAAYKRPVLVFIHGGSFNTGYGSSKLFAPTYFADQQVILVVMNYRLGPLGFFSLGSKPAPGNYGLKDMVLALKWVKENIEQFGGDPNLVTLMGQSAGAGATHILALSKQTEGLFDKYILHSGSALATWALHPRRSIRRSSLDLATSLGCLSLIRNTTETNITDSDNSTSTDQDNTKFEDYFEGEESEEFDEEVVECMRSMNTSSILEKIPEQYLWKENPYCIFGPTLEDDSSDDAILSIHPMEIIEKQLFRDMPCIIGVVRDEGLLKTIEAYIDASAQDMLIDNFEMFLPTFLEAQEVVNNVSELARAIEDFYFHGNISYNFINIITQVAGDGLITWPTYKAVKYQSEVMNTSLYFFLFSYGGTYSGTFKTANQIRYGVTHGDDINYLFPIYNYELSALSLHNTDEDWTMINVMTEMWANFMRTGVPRAWRTTEWPDYRDHREFMSFGAGRTVDIRVEGDFLSDRMEFWETLMGNVTDETFKLDLTMSTENSLDTDTKVDSSAIRAYDFRAASSFLCLVTILAWSM